MLDALHPSEIHIQLWPLRDGGPGGSHARRDRHVGADRSRGYCEAVVGVAVAVTSGDDVAVVVGGGAVVVVVVVGAALVVVG
ncbi:hypothetical protein [Nocardia xishanensis]|uniref:Uncharacterized protein n=1 Tax=Nocardia xishanensis TaxID=238964 RepID=A0ABW7X732_9NOCA